MEKVCWRVENQNEFVTSSNIGIDKARYRFFCVCVCACLCGL